MKIRYSAVALLLSLGLTGAATGCGKDGDKYEYVTTDSTGDCDQQDWDTRATDPESAAECQGKTGPDIELDKPKKVKKPATKKGNKGGGGTKNQPKAPAGGGNQPKAPKAPAGGGGGKR